MREHVTPKQVAQAIGVSESSLKRWCDKGILPMVRTAGGHRRLLVSTVMEFLRDSKHPLVRPEILGLPSRTGQGTSNLVQSRDAMREGLEAGDEEQCRRIALDLYLAGHPLCDIGDQVFAAAFHSIGSDWECGEIDVYQERRACEISAHVLWELRTMIPDLPEAAPIALGGTLSGDPYHLATTMVEIVLRENGWRADSLGIDLPALSLKAAIQKYQPRLFWLSVSHIEDKPRFVSDMTALFEACEAHGTALLIGGRALVAPLRKQLRYSCYCDNLRHVVDFARMLHRPVTAEATENS